MLGEFDFDHYFNNSPEVTLHHSLATHLAFSLFVITMSIIFMNLLVSYYFITNNNDLL